MCVFARLKNIIEFVLSKGGSLWNYRTHPWQKECHEQPDKQFLSDLRRYSKSDWIQDRDIEKFRIERDFQTECPLSEAAWWQGVVCTGSRRIMDQRTVKTH